MARTDTTFRERYGPWAVVAETLRRLGTTPQVIPGTGNRLSAFALRRLLPRTTTIRLMGRVMRGMYGAQ
jgi:hypothetical protein